MIIGLWKGEGLPVTFVDFFGKGYHEILAGCIIIFVAFIPFFAVKELGSVLGAGTLAYVDEYRFVYPAPQDNDVPVLTRAHDAARRATELDPSNARGQQALMMALFFRKDVRAAMEVGAKALALNPNDVELKGDYGYRLALSGNWTDGCRLVQEASDTGARKIAYFNTALALCHFYGGDLPTAATLVSAAGADENPAYHVVAAAILAQAGDSDAALEHRQWLEQNTPRQLPELLVDLPQRLVQPLDRQRFIDALRKAGFAGAS